MGRKLQLIESEIMVVFFGNGRVFYLVLAVTSLEGSQWPCPDQLLIRSLWSYKFVGFVSSPRFMIPTSVYRWREGKQSSILNPQPMVDWWLRLAVNHPKNPHEGKYCWNINLHHQRSIDWNPVLRRKKRDTIQFCFTTLGWGVALESCRNTS